MVMVVDQSGIHDTSDFENQFIDRYLLNDEIRGVTKVVRRFLHERNSKELDLLMGVQGWRRFIAITESNNDQSIALGKYCHSRMYPVLRVHSMDKYNVKGIPLNAMAKSPSLYTIPKFAMARGAGNKDTEIEEEAIPESVAVDTVDAVSANSPNSAVDTGNTADATNLHESGIKRQYE